MNGKRKEARHLLVEVTAELNKFGILRQDENLIVEVVYQELILYKNANSLRQQVRDFLYENVENTELKTREKWQTTVNVYLYIEELMVSISRDLKLDTLEYYLQRELKEMLLDCGIAIHFFTMGVNLTEQKKRR